MMSKGLIVHHRARSDPETKARYLGSEAGMENQKHGEETCR
jgi:hypothetical protein